MSAPSFLPERWGDAKKLTTTSAQGSFLVSDWHDKDSEGNGKVKMVPGKDLHKYPSPGTVQFLNSNGSLYNWADPNGSCTNIYSGEEGKPYLRSCDAGYPYSWKGGTDYTDGSNTKKGSGLYYHRTGIETKGYGNLCYNPNKGIYTVGQYAGKKFGKWNDKECSWIDKDTAVWCCSTPNILEGDKKYCDPSYLPNTSAGTCPALMLEECQNNWNNQACKNYLQVFKNSPDAQKVVKTAIVNKLNSKSPPDYTPARDKNDPFLKATVPNLCSTVPGSCDGLLDQYCAQFKKSDLNKDPTLQRLCGCHLSKGTKPIFNEINLENKEVQPNQYNYPGVKVECDPLCRFSNTISYSKNIGGVWIPAQCDATTCILSNISLNQINSEGGFNIDQNCGGCGDGNCSCYITDVIINEINSKGKVNLNQNCGSCYVTKEGESGADAKRVECSTLGPYAGGGGFWGWVDKNKILIFVIGIILIIIIVVAISVIMIKKEKK